MPIKVNFLFIKDESFKLVNEQACADKLAREMGEFGYPPQFPEEQLQVDKEEDEAVDSIKPAKKVKSKVATKAGSSFYQWDIMRTLGLEDEEIKEFCDPYHWLEYFPPLAKRDLTALGCRVRC